MNQLISERERETLILIALGKCNKEIGSALFISSKTVEKHRQNLLIKLRKELGIGQVGVSEITHYAIARGLVPLRFKPGEERAAS